ncbi:MAG: hypothetical protein RLZZ54_764 [Cyanobacteriota bacterium]|jgi:hypothetical protein
MEVPVENASPLCDLDRLAWTWRKARSRLFQQLPCPKPQASRVSICLNPVQD